MSKSTYFERLLIVAGVFLCFLLLTGILFPLIGRVFHLSDSARTDLLIVAVFQSLILFIAPAFIAAFFISRKPVEYLDLNRHTNWMAIIGVVIFYIIAMPAMNQIVVWNENIQFPESMEFIGETLRDMEQRAAEVTEIMISTDSAWGMIVNVLVIGLLTAVGEELFFRGTLQNTLGSNGARHAAIWITAFLFSAMHGQVFGFIPRLLLGAWFGYLLYWTGSIYVPIFAHFLNNSVVVVCAWLSSNGWIASGIDSFGATESGFPVLAFVSAVASVAFIYYFRKLFFFKRQLLPIYS